MPKSAQSMKPLYARLKAQGIERPYLLSAVLPDWWEDALYDEPGKRQLADLYIAKFLGTSIRHVTDPGTPLSPPDQRVRLKRSRGSTEDAHVSGAITAALHAARLVADLMKDRLPFTGTCPALSIRSELLNRPDCTWPDLKHLVDYCWLHGIGVVHVTRLPKAPGSKAIAGLATFVGDRPIIVLCSGRDSPAWLAFHLAHELGHIMSGHVRPGAKPLVDLDLGGMSDEAGEREADQYGFQVLTGHPQLLLDGPPMNGEALAVAARRFGELQRIHPGTVALIYGYCRGRIPVAQRALTAMGEDRGGRAILAAAFRDNVMVDSLPESAERFLGATTEIFGSTPDAASD